MKKKLFSLETLGSVCLYAFLTLIAAVMVYPILNILAVSLSDRLEYIKTPWMLLPRGINLEAYRYVFKNELIYSSYRNTIFITVTGTFLGLFATTLMAYPLSRPETKGKPFFMTYIVTTMIFSAGMIPSFLNVRNLGLYNSHWAIILTSALSAYNCILMVNFFRNIPESLFEAAKIDGAGELFILLRIVLPLSGPVLATITLFSAVGYWNNYFYAQIYLLDRELWPLAMLLKEILTEAKTKLLESGGNIAEMDFADIPTTSLQYAMLMVSMIPIMCVYPFLQKYFAKGVMLGSVKE